MSNWKMALPRKTGNTCGTTANRKRAVPPAPVAAMASTGPRPTFSMASAVVFDMNPTERQPSASIPGSGPSPSAATKTRAKMISWVERESTISARPTGKVRSMLGVVVVAASQATGIDRTTASRVPQKAISAVSNSGPRIFGT